MASHPIYQFYAELDNFEPRIWRRFQVAGNITVARLGYIIQVLFEMTASHLMALEVPAGENICAHLRATHPEHVSGDVIRDIENHVLRFELMDEDDEPIDDPHRDVRVEDAVHSRLRQAVSTPGDKLNFNYDFGDDWWVSLTLEAVFENPELPGKELPRVLEGAGFGIVEDVGGTGGLADLVEAFNQKAGEAYEQFSAWLGVQTFDISAFDLDDMNFRLKKIPRIYKQSYEDMLTPTQASIDLIERKYLQKKPAPANPKDDGAVSKQYNKLVRDNIPDIIEASGKTCTCEILPDAEYVRLLHAKLIEEVNEFLESGEVEELADISEVIHAILAQRGVTPDELESLRLEKRTARGGFEQKILLKEVTE